jgi:lysocardiolipin and lysophospholipid acyltransferase
MHWRRFAVSTIPVADADKFDEWLRERWAEKDVLLDYFHKNDAFPADPVAVVLASGANPSNADAKALSDGVIITKVSPSHPVAFIQIFLSALAVPLVWKASKWIFWIVSFFIRFR